VSHLALQLKNRVNRFYRALLWKRKINLLLEALATKDDIAGWCLYSCFYNEESNMFVETCVYWFSNARFEFFRTSAPKKETDISEEDKQGEDSAYSSIKSSSIVVEESYLIKRILIFVDPKDFAITYHPQLEEISEDIETFIREEIQDALDEIDKDDEGDKGEGEQVG